MENFEAEAKRLEEKIMALFEKAMSSPEARFEVFESLGGITVQRWEKIDPNRIPQPFSGREILEGIAEKVLDGKWIAAVSEDLSGKCYICII